MASSRQVEPLAGDGVEAIPEPCRTCLFWELGASRPSARMSAPPFGGSVARQPSDPLVRKDAWVSARVQEGTPPGRIVRVDGVAAAHAVFAPTRTFAPRRLPVPAASPDTLLLATTWVQPDWRDHGLGRLLAQTAIREALRLGMPAVEAYGDRRWRERDCLLPATWLLHEGFVVHREHLRTPLFRLDVKRTVRWADSLEHVWEEVLGRLPRRSPVPVPDGPPGRVPHRTAGRPPGDSKDLSCAPTASCSLIGLPDGR